MELAKERGWWDGVEPFNWCHVIGGEARGSLTAPDRRWLCGRRLLQDKSGAGKFSVRSMMEVLRDKDSGINRPGGDFPTAASQVSTLGSVSTKKRPGHWFTASPDPDNAVFKPFVFGQNITKLSDDTRSPKGDMLPPSQRQHCLWKRVIAVKGNRETFAETEHDAINACEQERSKSDNNVKNIFDQFEKQCKENQEFTGVDLEGAPTLIELLSNNHKLSQQNLNLQQKIEEFKKFLSSNKEMKDL